MSSGACIVDRDMEFKDKFASFGRDAAMETTILSLLFTGNDVR